VVVTVSAEALLGSGR